MKMIFVGIAVGLLMTGCVSGGERIEENNVELIKEGITTEAEVVALFGEPYAKTLDFDGNVIAQYEREYVTMRKWSLGDMETHEDMLFVTYDAGGTVKKYTLENKDTTVKWYEDKGRAGDMRKTLREAR